MESLVRLSLLSPFLSLPTNPSLSLSLFSLDCSSKAAALSFHEGLTEELRHVYLPHSEARRIRTSIVCPAHIKTRMFEGFTSSIPGWLAPSLEVETVGMLVTQTVLSGESQVSSSSSSLLGREYGNTDE